MSTNHTFATSAMSTFVIALALTPELTTAMSLVIAATLAGLVNLYVARTARLVALKEVAKMIAPVAAKIDAISPVVDRINTHVNSEKDRNTAELANRDMQIALQREMIDKMEKAALLLAQAKATVDLSTAISQAAVAGAATPVHQPSPVLSSIDKNTKDTASNTARTESTVQELKEKESG